MTVYFIQCSATKNVKIGFTRKNPEARLSSLQTGNPSRLSLLFHVEAEAGFEAYLHSRFDRYRVSGEWFLPGVLDGLDIDATLNEYLIGKKAAEAQRQSYGNWADEKGSDFSSQVLPRLDPIIPEAFTNLPVYVQNCLEIRIKESGLSICDFYKDLGAKQKFVVLFDIPVPDSFDECIDCIAYYRQASEAIRRFANERAHEVWRELLTRYADAVLLQANIYKEQMVLLACRYA